MMLAMHMADGLLTPQVALVMILLSGAVLAWAARQTQRRFDPARVPLMGVLGAFVFAAQMINFPILPGTSGHLGGGLLLALVLGPHAAVLVMASILIIQCLIFQDGGILALGANIFNLGVIPCYVGYVVHRVVAGAAPRPGRAYVAIFVAALVGVAAGAAMVPVQVLASGLLAVPFSKFLLLMIGFHLLIALVESLITFGVVGYLAAVRPEAVTARLGVTGSARVVNARIVAGSVLAVAVLLAGLVSLYASGWPDALEALAAGEGGRTAMVGKNTSDTIQAVEHLHERIAPLPNYGGIERWSSAPGIIGTLITLVVVWAVAQLLRRQPRKDQAHESG